MCAERADHNGLRAWVRATQGLGSATERNYQDAARHRADGLRYATGSAKLYLASNYALELARTGDTEHASETLRFAQQLAETNDQTADELPGPFTCTVARAGGSWSEAQLNLGAADAALDYADRAITAFEAAPPDQRDPISEQITRQDKVRAHLALGQLDGAELALAPVLETPPELRVRRLIIRMQDIHDATSTDPHRTDPTTTRIRDAITGFLHETNQREFPS